MLTGLEQLMLRKFNYEGTYCDRSPVEWVEEAIGMPGTNAA